MTKKPPKSTRVNLSNPQPRLLDHDKFIESKLKKIMKSNFQPIRKKKYICMHAVLCTETLDIETYLT